MAPESLGPVSTSIVLNYGADKATMKVPMTIAPPQ